MAQLGTGAAKIVRTQAIEAEVRRVLLHYMPDQPLSDAFAPVLARAADTSEDLPIGQTARRSPDVHCCLHPFWYGHGPDMPTFAYEVDYGPVFLPPFVSAENSNRPVHAFGARILAGPRESRGLVYLSESLRLEPATVGGLLRL